MKRRSLLTNVALFSTFLMTACGASPDINLGFSLAGSGGSHPPAGSGLVANAGPDQNVMAETVVTLNGSGSSGAGGAPLTYSWSFISKPFGSAATLSDVTVVNPTFTPDVQGRYVLGLVVSSGTVNSNVDVVIVTATPPLQGRNFLGDIVSHFA